MEDDLQEKQGFLRENILERGYDADEFMTFLQSKKGESGLDLNNWKMDELIIVVGEFSKNKHVKPNQDEEEKEPKEKNLEENEQNIKTENNENPENNTDIQNNNTNNFVFHSSVETGDYMGKCQASEITSFSNINNIRVKLSSPKKIEGGIFKKAFISYDVTTEPFKFQMTKRYSDFLWLKNMLSLIYVNCVIPPLCKKNFTDRFSDYLIDKRMRSIEKFMDGILEHPLMRNSEIIKDFLSLTNPKEYNKKVDKYNKIKKAPTFVRQIKTLTGEVNIEVNNEKEAYFEKIKNYSKDNYLLLQKITKGYKSIMNIMQQLSNKMKDISKIWKQVLDISIKNSDGHNTAETFNIMSKLMEDWSEVQISQMKVINVNIREYFRYVKNQFNGLKEMSERVQNSKTTYLKFKEKLLKQKETLYEKQDPSQWQLKEEDRQNVMNIVKNKDLAFSKMLPQDTIKMEELKNFYGCMLNSAIGEYERIRRINAKRHKEYTTKFVRELSKELTTLHMSVVDRLSEFNELKDDFDDEIKIEEKIVKLDEPNQENLEENNDNNINNIDNKNINEENKIDNIENKDDNKNNDEANKKDTNEEKNKNSDNEISKDLAKAEHSKLKDNNLKEKDKKQNEDKNKEKEKEKKIDNKKLDKKNIKDEKKNIVKEENKNKNKKEEKIMNDKKEKIEKNKNKVEIKQEKKVENKKQVDIKKEKENKIKHEDNQQKKEEIINKNKIKDEKKKEEPKKEVKIEEKKKEEPKKEIKIEEKKEEPKKEVKIEEKKDEKKEEIKIVEKKEEKKEEIKIDEKNEEKKEEIKIEEKKKEEPKEEIKAEEKKEEKKEEKNEEIKIEEKKEEEKEKKKEDNKIEININNENITKINIINEKEDDKKELKENDKLEIKENIKDEDIKKEDDKK